MADPRKELLRSINFFADLSDEDLGVGGASLIPRDYGDGQAVFRQGDSGSSMFLVESGHVHISLAGEGSKRVALKDIRRGGAFGELALFDDKPRSADAVCAAPTQLLELSRETLEAYLEKRPRAAIAIVRTLAERLRETNALLSARAAKNVDEEFDQALTWRDRLADRVAELNGSWAFILFLLGLTAAWCTLNTLQLFGHALDPYPFQFFNLALAILVGLQGPLIVMSQNRQAMKDRARAETGYKVNLKNEVNIEVILKELAELKAEARRAAGLPPLEKPAPRPSAPT